MSALLYAVAFYAVFTPALVLAIPRLAQRYDSRLDGRSGFHVSVAGTIPFSIHNDTEGLI